MKHIRLITAKTKKFHKNPTSLVLIFSAILLITYGAWQLWQRDQITNAPNVPVTQDIVTSSTDGPSESKPDCDNYKVDDNLPRVISLPSVGAEGCIMRVGIDQKGAIAVPNNIHLAGWYTNSVLPGEKGLSIIDGHVSGKYNPGIFKNLIGTKPGDQFQIEFGNGSIKKYEIISVNSYTPEETTKKMYETIEGIDSQLNLITCGGDFNSGSNQYEKRILVTSKLIV